MLVTFNPPTCSKVRRSAPMTASLRTIPPASFVGQELAVGTEGQLRTECHMAWEQVKEFVGLGVIQPDSRIASHRQTRTIR